MISIVYKDDIDKLTRLSDSQAKKLLREAKSKLVSESFSSKGTNVSEEDIYRPLKTF